MGCGGSKTEKATIENGKSMSAPLSRKTSTATAPSTRKNSVANIETVDGDAAVIDAYEEGKQESQVINRMI